MPRHSITSSKSPLHPSALRMKDLRPGMRVLTFNRAYGITGEYTIVSLPFAAFPIGTSASEAYPLPHVQICLRGGARMEIAFLSDLGVIPYGGSLVALRWNEMKFLVAASKRHLLPVPDPSFKDDFDDDEGDRYFTGLATHKHHIHFWTDSNLAKA